MPRPGPPRRGSFRSAALRSVLLYAFTLWVIVTLIFCLPRLMPGVLHRATADSNAGRGNYTMALVGYGGLAGDADGLRTRFVPSRSQSFSTAKGYDNQRFNTLARQQAVTLDRAKRRDLVVEMQKIIADDLPILGIYVPHRTAFYDNTLFDNYYYTPGCSPCGVAGNKHMLVTGRKTGLPN